MNNFWSNIFLVLFVLLVLAYVIPVITGFNIISLSVAGKMSGELVSFEYEPVINVSDTQTIFTEFVNSGSENYTLKIEYFIYLYRDDGMDEVAYYYDSAGSFGPGMRRLFETKYIPLEMGFYYIKVRVSMGEKKMESWGSFYANFPWYNPPIPAEYQPIMIYPTVERLLSLDYPESVDLYPGRSIMTNLRVKNIGNATIHEVKLHISATNMLDIEINPKDSYYLDPGETLTFLIDISAPNDIPVAEYPIDFELVTRELRERGTITVNVIPYEINLEEEVRKTILNYGYLITDLEREILEAQAKGINVTSIRSELNEAKAKLEEAKSYYNSGEFENAKTTLEDVKDILKDVAFKIAQASFTVFVAPAFSPFWILIVAIAIALVFLFLQKRRKKEKKPKLLRTSEESET